MFSDSEPSSRIDCTAPGIVRLRPVARLHFNVDGDGLADDPVMAAGLPPLKHAGSFPCRQDRQVVPSHRRVSRTRIDLSSSKSNATMPTLETLIFEFLGCADQQGTLLLDSHEVLDVQVKGPRSSPCGLRRCQSRRRAGLRRSPDPVQAVRPLNLTSTRAGLCTGQRMPWNRQSGSDVRK